jgi:LacI family transcriptional regulator
VTTIYDIAKAAGTSPASVSRVINGRQGVGADAAKRIRAAIESKGFQPRWKALDRDRLLVFIPEHKRTLDSGYVARILSGIADSSFALGLGLQLRPFSSHSRNVADLRQLYLQEAVSGCIVISTWQGYPLASKLDLSGLPHVVVGHKTQDDGIHQVLLDEEAAGRNAAEFLLSLGHRRIAMISFSHLDLGHRERYQGFAQAMKGAGGKPPVCIQCDEATGDMGRSAARRLLSPIERPSAVIVTNEDIAAGFQAEARAMKFSIPGDLSLIAFEETDKLALLDTPVTAMQTPAYNMGVEAVRMLRSTSLPSGKRTRGSQARFATKLLPIPLLARHSTAPAK